MSAYTKLTTSLRDPESIKYALEQLGLTPVIDMQEGYKLKGYAGHRNPICQIAVTSEEIQRSLSFYAKDIGFERLPTGEFQYHVNDMNEGTLGVESDFWENFNVEYNVGLTKAKAKKLGARLLKRTDTVENGRKRARLVFAHN